MLRPAVRKTGGGLSPGMRVRDRFGGAGDDLPPTESVLVAPFEGFGHGVALVTQGDALGGHVAPLPGEIHAAKQSRTLVSSGEAGEGATL